jgi:hypothetical protein
LPHATGPPLVEAAGGVSSGDPGVTAGVRACAAVAFALVAVFLSGCRDERLATYMPVSHDPHCLDYESLDYCFRVAPRQFGLGNMPVGDVTWQRWGAEQAVGRGEVLTRECIPSCVGGRSWWEKVTVTVSVPVNCDGIRTYSRLRVQSRPSSSEYAYGLPLPCGP